MEFRSTNDQGYSHFKGDVISNVSSGGVQNSSHGVMLTGSNTGGVVTAAGDEQNIPINIRGKGTGGVIFGSTAQSTSAVQALQRYFIDYTVPTLSSNSASVSTVTVTGLTTNSILVLTPRLQNNSTVAGVYIEPRCSTANELSLTFINGAVSSLTGSTQSGYLLQVRF